MHGNQQSVLSSPDSRYQAEAIVAYGRQASPLGGMELDGSDLRQGVCAGLARVEYVKAMGGGDDAAHSCIGMPINSNK